MHRTGPVLLSLFYCWHVWLKLNLAIFCFIKKNLHIFLNHTIPTILRHIAPLNGLRVHLVESIVHFKRFRLSLVTRHFAQELEDVDNELFCFCHANHEWRLCGWVRIEVFISSLGRLDRCSWTYLEFLTFCNWSFWFNETLWDSSTV